MKNHVLIADETDLMFTQHVIYADKEEQQKPMRTSIAPPEDNERDTRDP